MSKIKLEKDPADIIWKFDSLQDEIDAFNHRMDFIKDLKETVKEKPANIQIIKSMYKFIVWNKNECKFLAAKIYEIQKLSDAAFREIVLRCYRQNDFFAKYSINPRAFLKKKNFLSISKQVDFDKPVSKKAAWFIKTLPAVTNIESLRQNIQSLEKYVKNPNTTSVNPEANTNESVEIPSEKMSKRKKVVYTGAYIASLPLEAFKIAISFDTKDEFLKAFQLEDNSFHKELREATIQNAQNKNHDEYKSKWLEKNQNQSRKKYPFSLIDDAMNNVLEANTTSKKIKSERPAGPLTQGIFKTLPQSTDQGTLNGQQNSVYTLQSLNFFQGMNELKQLVLNSPPNQSRVFDFQSLDLGGKDVIAMSAFDENLQDGLNQLFGIK